MRLNNITLFVIFAVLIIGVFGFSILSLVGHNGEYGCVVSLIPGGDCSFISEGMAIAFHHIAGIQNLIQAVAKSNIFLMVLSFVAFLTFKILSSLIKIQNLKLFFRYLQFKRKEIVLKFKEDFLNWLALIYRRNPHLFL